MTGPAVTLLYPLPPACSIDTLIPDRTRELTLRNRGTQVVAFQATMELMAEQFPGAFAGYRLQVVESHQRSKVDTSGTARAIVQSFQKLGLHFDEVC